METKVYKLISAKKEVICNRMIVATNLFERMLGLMFSKELPNCDGFLIRPCNSIHTFFMLYPIDVIFLDKNFKIINIIRNLKPWRMTSIYFKSSMVLELKGGTLLNEVSVGDQLEAICIS